jgi:hypothetical protein
LASSAVCAGYLRKADIRAHKLCDQHPPQPDAGHANGLVRPLKLTLAPLGPSNWIHRSAETPLATLHVGAGINRSSPAPGVKMCRAPTRLEHNFFLVRLGFPEVLDSKAERCWSDRSGTLGKRRGRDMSRHTEAHFPQPLNDLAVGTCRAVFPRKWRYLSRVDAR